MKDILTDLRLTTSKKNWNNIPCPGCKIRAEELFEMEVDDKVVLMCEDCKETLIAHFNKEEAEHYVSAVNKTFKDGIAVNKNGTNQSNEPNSGLYDSIKYHTDHMDC